MAELFDMETERFLLRRWRDADREPFARMNADPTVMEFYPAAALSRRKRRHGRPHQDAFCAAWFWPWAAELRETGEFIGYVGLAVPHFVAAFTPCVEIGWRLASDSVGEGARDRRRPRGAFATALNSSRCREIVSFTVPANIAFAPGDGETGHVP